MGWVFSVPGHTCHAQAFFPRSCFQKQAADPPSQGKARQDPPLRPQPRPRGTSGKSIPPYGEHNRDEQPSPSPSRSRSQLRAPGRWTTPWRSRLSASALSLWKRRHLGERRRWRPPLLRARHAESAPRRRKGSGGGEAGAGVRMRTASRSGGRGAQGRTEPEQRRARMRRAAPQARRAVQAERWAGPRSRRRRRTCERRPARGARRRRGAGGGWRRVPGCGLRREGLQWEDGRLPVGGGGNGMGGRQLRGFAFREATGRRRVLGDACPLRILPVGLPRGRWDPPLRPPAALPRGDGGGWRCLWAARPRQRLERGPAFVPAARPGSPPSSSPPRRRAGRGRAGSSPSPDVATGRAGEPAPRLRFGCSLGSSSLLPVPASLPPAAAADAAERVLGGCGGLWLRPQGEAAGLRCGGWAGPGLDQREEDSNKLFLGGKKRSSR